MSVNVRADVRMNPRVAWLFPGQGSQAVGMTVVVAGTEHRLMDLVLSARFDQHVSSVNRNAFPAKSAKIPKALPEQSGMHHQTGRGADSLPKRSQLHDTGNVHSSSLQLVSHYEQERSGPGHQGPLAR